MMRLFSWLSLLLLASVGAYGQRGGFGRPAGGFPGGAGPFMPGRGFVAPLGRGLPPVSPIPWLSPNQPLGIRPPGAPAGPIFNPVFPISGYYPYPFFGGGYYTQPQTPAVLNYIVIQNGQQPQTPAAEPEPPANPVHAVVHEVTTEAAPASPTASTGEPRAFIIALKDGTSIDADAVWVQGDSVGLVDTGGEHRRVPLETVDREATEQRNREQNLNLRIPPPR